MDTLLSEKFFTALAVATPVSAIKFDIGMRHAVLLSASKAPGRATARVAPTFQRGIERKCRGDPRGRPDNTLRERWSGIGFWKFERIAVLCCKGCRFRIVGMPPP